jgi:hypothetical protein
VEIDCRISVTSRASTLFTALHRFCAITVATKIFLEVARVPGNFHSTDGRKGKFQRILWRQKEIFSEQG